LRADVEALTLSKNPSFPFLFGGTFIEGDVSM